MCLVLLKYGANSAGYAQKNPALNGAKFKWQENMTLQLTEDGWMLTYPSALVLNFMSSGVKGFRTAPAAVALYLALGVRI